jgi:hypothetical protein
MKGPHPTGGEVKRLPLNQNPGKMPKNQKVSPITHTDLDVGGDDGLGQMPRKSSTPPQTMPVRR